MDYTIPDNRNYALYDYQPRDLGFHPEEDKISNASKVMAALFAVAHAADWAQTNHIARNPEKYYESGADRFIGKHPSTGKVNGYMAITGLTNGLLPFLLPKGYRETAQAITVTDKVRAVNNNRKIGIGLR